MDVADGRGIRGRDVQYHGRKIYWQDMQPSNFIDPGIAKSYPKMDYHRIYFGEIVAVAGSEAFGS